MRLNESLPNTISPEEQAKIKELMQTFLADKQTWIDKYGLEQANFVMYKTAVKQAKNPSKEKEQPEEETITEGLLLERMDLTQLKERIKNAIKQIQSEKTKSDTAAVEFDELTKFPELKKIIVDLLTADFDNFLSSIDWVAPRPSTFRINLKNGQSFYIMYGKRSWIAQVEGKKYYLLNLPEEERAVEAIARILRYGKKEEEAADEFSGGGGEEIGGGEEAAPEETPEETPEA